MHTSRQPRTAWGDSRAITNVPFAKQNFVQTPRTFEKSRTSLLPTLGTHIPLPRRPAKDLNQRRRTDCERNNEGYLMNEGSSLSVSGLMTT